MSSEGLPGPSFELKGSPIIPADMDAFLGAYGVKSLDANVPVAADAAMQWIHDKFDSANQESGVETGSGHEIPATVAIEGYPDPVSTARISAFSGTSLSTLLGAATPQAATFAVPASVCTPQTLRCFLNLLEGKPHQAKPGEAHDTDEDSDEEMGQHSRALIGTEIPMRTAFELFAAADYFHMVPKLWPCLLLYVKPFLPHLSMEEAAWMAATMLAVAPSTEYRTVVDALFHPGCTCVATGPGMERSRLFHASEPMLSTLGAAFCRMNMTTFTGKSMHWTELVSAVSLNHHVPAPVTLGLFAAACMMTPEATPAPDGEVAKSLGNTLDCFLAHVLRQGTAMASVRALVSDVAEKFDLGAHAKAVEAVVPRLLVLEGVAGSATAATASDARSRASGEDAGSQDGDSGSLDMGIQAEAVERSLRHECAARALGGLERGDCCVVGWGLHTCPSHRIVVARLQVPTSDGESVSGAAGHLAMAVSCVEARLGSSGDAGAAPCSLGVSVRYACESKGAAAMVFAQAAAEAARPTAAQWSEPGGGVGGASEVYVHALGVLPTARSNSQSSRVADALCTVQEAWEGDWGVRETSHDWYALAADGVPVPMIHRVVEGGGMEMQPGSAAGVNNLWGVSQFCHGATSWLSRGVGAASRPDLLGKEVFVYACIEVQ